MVFIDVEGRVRTTGYRAQRKTVRGEARLMEPQPSAACRWKLSRGCRDLIIRLSGKSAEDGADQPRLLARRLATRSMSDGWVAKYSPAMPTLMERVANRSE